MLMAYKTATAVDGTMMRCIGALTADNWTAWPYDHFPLGAPNACIGADPHLEDPSNLWEDRRGNVHFLTHNNGWGGAAASPNFGSSWHFNCSRLSYDYEVEYEDGTPATVTQMAKDVAAFLAWTSEPEHDDRKKNGMQWLVAIAVGIAVTGFYKRFRWSILKTRKITYTK